MTTVDVLCGKNVGSINDKIKVYCPLLRRLNLTFTECVDLLNAGDSIRRENIAIPLQT